MKPIILRFLLSWALLIPVVVILRSYWPDAPAWVLFLLGFAFHFVARWALERARKQPPQ